MSGVRTVSTAEALGLAADGYRLIDVREQSEWDEGHIAGATLVPLATVPERLPELVPDPATPLLLYCHSGARSARASAYLAQVGYTNVANLAARVAEWKPAGGAWEEPQQLLKGERRADVALAMRPCGLGLPLDQHGEEVRQLVARCRRQVPLGEP